MDIVKTIKMEMLKRTEKYGSFPYQLKSHLFEVEKWGNYMTKKYKKADYEIVMLSIWLHDIGHYPINWKIDHAMRSEKIAKQLLSKNNYNQEKMLQVIHCVRAHRCRDVMPQTLEAKMVAFCDSASHLTDIVYLDMAKSGDITRALGKLERDFRDLGTFPKEKDKLRKLYSTWKIWLKSLEKNNPFLINN